MTGDRRQDPAVYFCCLYASGAVMKLGCNLHALCCLVVLPLRESVQFKHVATIAPCQDLPDELFVVPNNLSA